MNHITIHIRQSPTTRMWYATCDEFPGLQIEEYTREQAIMAVPQEIDAAERKAQRK